MDLGLPPPRKVGGCTNSSMRHAGSLDLSGGLQEESRALALGGPPMFE